MIKQSTIHCPAQARIPCPAAPSGSRRRPAPPCAGWGQSRDPLRRPQKGPQARHFSPPRHRPDPAPRLTRAYNEMAGTPPRRRTARRRFGHDGVALAAPPGSGRVCLARRMYCGGVILAAPSHRPCSRPVTPCGEISRRRNTRRASSRRAPRMPAQELAASSSGSDVAWWPRPPGCNTWLGHFRRGGGERGRRERARANFSDLATHPQRVHRQSFKLSVAGPTHERMTLSERMLARAYMTHGSTEPLGRTTRLTGREFWRKRAKMRLINCDITGP